MYQIKPFYLTGSASDLVSDFPDKDFISTRLASLNGDELDSFIRLWLTEGFPFAFREKPMLFELARYWLARELNVNPKEVILVGSARSGFSLTPGKEFGNSFSSNSDLDFALISDDYFKSLEAAFLLWKVDYEAGSITPRNDTETKYWLSNIEQLPRNIKNGFIDPYKIAHREKYNPVVVIQDALARLNMKIKNTALCPRIKNVSIRVFKNWDAFMKRARFNLRSIEKNKAHQ